jgi:hypothetical protein
LAAQVLLPDLISVTSVPSVEHLVVLTVVGQLFVIQHGNAVFNLEQTAVVLALEIIREHLVQHGSDTM